MGRTEDNSWRTTGRQVCQALVVLGQLGERLFLTERRQEKPSKENPLEDKRRTNPGDRETGGMIEKLGKHVLNFYAVLKCSQIQ